jgi:hypothetical protein
MSRLKIVVSNTSVVIDPARVKLIEPVVRRPFEFVIPDVILARERADPGPYTAAELLALGFVKGALDAVNIRCARENFRQYRERLSLGNCFAWRLGLRSQISTGPFLAKRSAVAAARGLAHET